MKFEPLGVKDKRSFEDLYRIYRKSIPPREQKPKDQIAAMARRPDYRILLAKREGTVIGFSVLFLPSRERFSLLEYMAVEAAERSGGVGSALFLHSLQAIATVQGAVPVLLEVDSTGSDSPDHEILRRRQQFYRRLGCLWVEDLSYILPLPMEPPKMDLLVYLPSSVRNISKGSLEGWLKVVYRDVYGCSPDDSRIVWMMEPVDDPVRLL